jgi:hypothetical protein
MVELRFASTGSCSKRVVISKCIGYALLICLVITGLACEKQNVSVPVSGSPKPPTVTAGDATGIAYDGALLTGTVNPNGLLTTYHFVYDMSMSYVLYESRTSDFNAGSGMSSISVSSAINSLSPSTKYWYRLVASNTAGADSADGPVFTTSAGPMRHFTFPSAIGNTWIYQYKGSSSSGSHCVTGVHTWRIVGPDGTGGWLVMDVRQDTTEIPTPPKFSTDSVFFSLLIKPDSISIHFPEWFRNFTQSVEIPTSFPSASDTLTIYNYITYGLDTYERVVYCSGVGLVTLDEEAGSMASRMTGTLTLLHRNF